MIRALASKTNDFCVKGLSYSGAMTCNLCLELIHLALPFHQTIFNQHFPGKKLKTHATAGTSITSKEQLRWPAPSTRLAMLFSKREKNFLLHQSHKTIAKVPELQTQPAQKN